MISLLLREHVYTVRPGGSALATVLASSCTAAVTTAVERLLKAALTLSNEEREELIAALSQTLEPVAVDPAWKTELARRIAKIESGEAVFHDAELHAQQLRATFE
jgi:hypothetical protein